jgi:biotin carboxyl carrier protein
MRKFNIKVNGKIFEVEVEEKAAAGVSIKRPLARRKARRGGKEANITSPIAGIILEIKKTPGAKVRARETVIILEAMKMENNIVSPIEGVVKEVTVKKNQKVNTGELLMVITPSGLKT